MHHKWFGRTARRARSLVSASTVILTYPLAATAQVDDATPTTPTEETPATDAVPGGESTRESARDEAGEESSEVAQESAADAATEGAGALQTAPSAPTAEQYAELEARLAALEAAREEEELNELTESEAEDAARQDPVKIYGFMDMGLQRLWTDESSIISGYFEANAWTFAMGNVDIYFDANPHPDWRALAEVRFTNAPRGRINNFGGLAGQFEREDTQQFDPNSTVVNAPMWLGGVIIERAWIEWNRFPAFQVRTGNFFTPFGIWNVDHGQPTLISSFLPQFMLQNYFPIRQTGVQALGSFFLKEWELGYRAWISNGREDATNLDFNDDKAVGTRLYLRNELGKVRTQIGGSVHHGRVADKVVSITQVPTESQALEFEIEETVAYYETILGLDLSLDIHDTRIRAEGIARLQLYEDGKRGAPSQNSAVSNSVNADDWAFGGYIVVAQRLKFWGLEPYLYGDIMQQNRGFPDGIVTAGPGLNVHFNPSAMLKLQASRGVVFDWTEDLPGDASSNNTDSFVSRIVIAF